MEEFRDIPGYEGLYQVSNIGNVKSLTRTIIMGGVKRLRKGRIMKSSLIGPGRKPYSGIGLHKNNKRKSFSIHQLVAMAFLNHIPNGHVGLIVDHINNDCTDNRLENLQLISNRENVTKDMKVGTSQYTGVSMYKLRNGKFSKWQAHIRINGKTKYLGLFECELEASETYQKALRELLASEIKDKSKIKL
jgi:hypothetical protein